MGFLWQLLNLLMVQASYITKNNRLSEIISVPISQNNYSDWRGSLNSLQARTEKKQKHILAQLCYENLITEQIFIQAPGHQLCMCDLVSHWDAGWTLQNNIWMFTLDPWMSLPDQINNWQVIFHSFAENCWFNLFSLRGRKW